MHEVGHTDQSNLSVAADSFSVISRIFMRSCRQLNDAAMRADVNFKEDAIARPQNVPRFVSCCAALETAIRDANSAQDEAKLEYERFQVTSNALRTAAAVRVSEALQAAATAHAEFNEKFLAATALFEHRKAQMRDESLVTNVVTTSDVHMDRIKAKAEENLAMLGAKLKELQAAEAQTALDLR